MSMLSERMHQPEYSASASQQKFMSSTHACVYACAYQFGNRQHWKVRILIELSGNRANKKLRIACLSTANVTRPGSQLSLLIHIPISLTDSHQWTVDRLVHTYRRRISVLHMGCTKNSHHFGSRICYTHTQTY